MSHQQDQNPVMDALTDQSENEVESAMRMEEGEQPRFPSSCRQTSVYSLSLDEFQNTLTGGGRNYGSMNMDEFLQSIWNAEGNEVPVQNNNIAMPAVAPKRNEFNNINPRYPFSETSNKRGTSARHMSLTVPAPVFQRTVEEVWSEINGTQQSTSNIAHAGSNSKQISDPTDEEMTLEDFLVREGVVRVESAIPAQPPPVSLPPPQLSQLQPHMYANCNNTAVSYSFMAFGCGGAGSVNVPPKAMPQICGANVSAHLLGENGCGTESYEQISPGSSDRKGMSKPGKKRNRPEAKVIENRQKRMIKNRESAARSRARKHAYTIELEAELNHLKEENASLRHRLAELGTRSMQQNTEAAKAKTQARAKDRLGLLRRCLSSPF